ncbi:MAG: hypothetical protein ABW133_06220, partial [Polyangiaceae bacterium]
MKRMSPAFALALLLFLGGCASAPRVPPDVDIVFNAEPGKLPFDPHSARLRGAMDKLAHAVGRPMTLDLDVALLREFPSWFETGLITAIENAAHDLGELKRTRDEAWAEIGPRLKTLSFRYDAAATKVDVKLDGNAVAVMVPAKATTLLPHEAALLSLEAQYNAKLPEKYAGGIPASVSVAEKRAYFRALTGQKPPPKKPNDPATAPGVANDFRATAILRAIQFFDVAMPLELRAEIHEWLLNEGTFFRDAYLVFPDAVKASPATSPFHRAEAAWVDWAQQNGDRFTDAERAALARLVFVKAPEKGKKGPARSLPFAFPGFDRIAFGLHVLEEWSEAGHPRVISGRDRLIELFDLVVCPFEIDNRGERVQPDGCDHDFYAAVAEAEPAQKKLLEFLLVKKDQVLIETVFANFMRIRATHAASFLWRGVEAEETLWKGATFALAEELGHIDAGKLQDEALRLWQTYPARRVPLLYLLSQIDRYGNDRIAWGAFGEGGGARASAADFKGFLEYGRRAYATAWVVWPLLARGWSRADALVPGLDKYVDDPLTPFFHPQDPELALAQMVSRTCAEKNFADLAKFHAYFVDRIKKMPSDEPRFAELLQSTTKGKCKPNARPVVRATPLDPPLRAPRADATAAPGA